MIETSKWSRSLTLFRHLADQILPAFHLGLISVFCRTGDKILKPHMKRNVVLNETKTITRLRLQTHYHTRTATLKKSPKSSCLEWIICLEQVATLSVWKMEKMLSNGEKVSAHCCLLSLHVVVTRATHKIQMKKISHFFNV